MTPAATTDRRARESSSRTSKYGSGRSSSRPARRFAMHHHDLDYVVVTLTEGQTTVEWEDGRRETREQTPGALTWREAPARARPDQQRNDCLPQPDGRAEALARFRVRSMHATPSGLRGDRCTSTPSGLRGGCDIPFGQRPCWPARRCRRGTATRAAGACRRGLRPAPTAMLATSDARAPPAPVRQVPSAGGVHRSSSEPPTGRRAAGRSAPHPLPRPPAALPR